MYLEKLAKSLFRNETFVNIHRTKPRQFPVLSNPSLELHLTQHLNESRARLDYFFIDPHKIVCIKGS